MTLFIELLLDLNLRCLIHRICINSRHARDYLDPLLFLLRTIILLRRFFYTGRVVQCICLFHLIWIIVRLFEIGGNLVLFVYFGILNTYANSPMVMGVGGLVALGAVLTTYRIMMLHLLSDFMP